MLRSQVWRAASSTWFDAPGGAPSFAGAFKGMAMCLGGIALINLWFRGDAFGRADRECDVYIPVPLFRTHLREPSSDGFVDSSLDHGGEVGVSKRP
uniref:Uncharacterized protein n=1 Tax=Trypanosoma vivax (strain Y486) TaxID=1055687 RepID=G0U9S9_TRYVY|nr:conserved hypothetical protein [Trypanosoma vivax Y486]